VYCNLNGAFQQMYMADLNRRRGVRIEKTIKLFVKHREADQTLIEMTARERTHQGFKSGRVVVRKVMPKTGAVVPKISLSTSRFARLLDLQELTRR